MIWHYSSEKKNFKKKKKKGKERFTWNLFLWDQYEPDKMISLTPKTKVQVFLLSYVNVKIWKY